MRIRFLQWRIGSNDTSTQVPQWTLSVALLIGSVIWLAAACVCSAPGAFKDHWAATPLFWMLILMVTPSVCFSIAVVLANTRQHRSLPWFDRCALAAAFLPVTLGSLLAIWAVKVFFWTSFQEASAALKIFGASASLGLVAISGAMIWKVTRIRRISEEQNA